MRTIFILAFLLTFNFLAAQISINFIFRDACSDSLIVRNYNLLHIRQFIHYHSIGSDLTIDSAGTYVIDASFQRGDRNVYLSFFRRFLNKRSYKDTIPVPKLLKDVMGLHSSEQTFSYCNTPANGYIEDFYSNGNLRIKGTFKVGYPESILSFYNINGVLVRKDFFKNGKIYKSKHFNKKDYSEEY